MLRTLITAAALSLAAGCCSDPDPLERPEPTGEPWDRTYLIDADPAAVDDAALAARADELLASYQAYNQSHGVVYPGVYSRLDLEAPDRFAGGGDSALFTGMAAAAFCYRGRETGDYAPAREALRGLWWLTHAAGPGVICRAAIPWAERERWGYPAAWQSRIDRGFAGPGPAITDTPYGPLPECAYYTRATRDQLTGILYGLSVAWADLPDERSSVAAIMRDLRAHLEAHNWKIRDQHGRNDTSADGVSRLLKTQFLALWQRVVQAENPGGWAAAHDEYKASLRASLASLANLAARANNYDDYYAHNLRAVRALSIWTLEDHTERRRDLRRFVERHVWAHTKGHQNAWFAAVVAHVTAGGTGRPEAAASLRSQSLKPLRGFGSPYAGQEHGPSLADVLAGCGDAWVLPPHLRRMTNYFIWTKRPWDVGNRDPNGFLHETGLDFLLPYWLLRATVGTDISD